MQSVVALGYSTWANEKEEIPSLSWATIFIFEFHVELGVKVKCFSILLTPFSFTEWANQNNNDSSIMLWQNETTEINQQSLLMYMLSTSKKQNKISEVFFKRFLKHSSQSSTKLKDGKAQFQTLYNALYNWFNFENKMQCTSSHNYFYAFLYRIVYGGVNEHIFIDQLYVFPS